MERGNLNDFSGKSWSRKTRLAVPVLALGLILTHTITFLWGRHVAVAEQASRVGASPDVQAALQVRRETPSTTVFAHNLLLRKGPNFRVYVRWLMGNMARTRKDVNPSFDAPESFVLMIQRGVLSVRLADLASFLNAGANGGVGALTNVSVKTNGDIIELHGTAHKIVPLPVKIVGTLSPLPDGRIQFHVASFSVLKLPLKGLLGAFHLSLSDLTAKSETPGIAMNGNDFDFDTQRLLPPPHIHGQITKVVLSSDQIRVYYGNASETDAQLAEWHNFLRFTGGSLNFGKITMNDVDLTMIDASKDPWFDLDLVNYQSQFLHSYSRITKGAGLEIFMPDADAASSAKQPQDAVSLDWLKDRHTSMPADVPLH